MFPYVETICIKNGEVQNLELHELRMNRTRFEVLGCENYISLKPFINCPSLLLKEIVKCRVLYLEDVDSITYTPYVIKYVNKLQLVIDDKINYNYKSTNRECLQKDFSQRDLCDDVLIVKNGEITDTSICNVAFFNGEEWFTPKRPLLRGTQRDYLLATNQIKEALIRIEDFQKYTHVTLFNALIPFKKILFPVLDHLYMP